MAMCEGSHADLMNHDAAVNDGASSPCAVPMRHLPFSHVEIRMFLNPKARFKAGPRHHDDWPMLGSEAILSAIRHWTRLVLCGANPRLSSDCHQTLTRFA